MVLKLYHELNNSKPITDFLTLGFSVSTPTPHHLWLLSQLILTLGPKIAPLTNEITQKMITAENTLITALSRLGDLNQVFMVYGLSNNRYHKQTTVRQLLRKILEREIAFNQTDTRIERETLSTFKTLIPDKEFAHSVKNIHCSNFGYKKAIRVLEESGEFEAAFEILYAYNRLRLLEIDNSLAVDQFKYLIEGIEAKPLSVFVFSDEQLLVKNFVEFELLLGQADYGEAGECLERILGLVSQIGAGGVGEVQEFFMGAMLRRIVDKCDGVFLEKVKHAEYVNLISVSFLNF